MKLQLCPCCVTMEKLFNLSEPQLPHLKNEDKIPPLQERVEIK